jgi:hypothetical protein
MENNKENIKIIMKSMKGSSNAFIQGCFKYYRKNKVLTDRQFQIVYDLYKNEISNNKI